MRIKMSLLGTKSSVLLGDIGGDCIVPPSGRGRGSGSGSRHLSTNLVSHGLWAASEGVQRAGTPGPLGCPMHQPSSPPWRENSPRVLAIQAAAFSGG